MWRKAVKKEKGSVPTKDKTLLFFCSLSQLGRFFLTHSSPVSLSFSSFHRCVGSVSVTMGKLVPSSRVHSIRRMATASPAGLGRRISSSVSGKASVSSQAESCHPLRLPGCVSSFCSVSFRAKDRMEMPSGAQGAHDSWSNRSCSMGCASSLYCHSKSIPTSSERKTRDALREG